MTSCEYLGTLLALQVFSSSSSSSSSAAADATSAALERAMCALEEATGQSRANAVPVVLPLPPPVVAVAVADAAAVTRCQSTRLFGRTEATQGLC